MAEYGLIAQLGAASASAFFFVASLVLCVLAFRAAGAAGRERELAAEKLRAAEAVAGEVRGLKAEIETAWRSAPEPVHHAAATAEPAVEASVEPDPALEEAKKAATVPSMLLGKFRRR